MSEMIGYCFKCKEKRTMENPQAEWSASGSPGTRGKCPVCEGTIYKMGRTDAHENLPKPDIVRKPKAKSSSKKKKSKSKKKSAPRRSGKLVIVESPAKAKTIGKYLGKGYTVKSSVGHVRDLLKSRLSVDVDNDYTPEYRVPNDKRPLMREIKAASDSAKEIYLATDPDREGEAIAWHVMESAEMDKSRVQRVVFHEVTKNAVQEAMERPRELDMDRVDAQQARRILDRLVGYNLSPLLWRKVRGRLSAGRVQSVAVRLVVEREREIDAFDPVEYWSLHANLSQNKFSDKKEKRPYFVSKWLKYEGKNIELNSEGDVTPHLEILEKAAWGVGRVKLGERRRKPAAPFTTSTLQQEASRKLSFTTGKTMRIAQQLYEGIDIGGETVGLITYMRTDSVTVSQEAQALTREHVTERFGAEYLPDAPPIYKTRSKSAQEAHEAIRPTLVTRIPAQLKDKLSRDQMRLYRLIWSRFVGSQMAPAVYATVSADIYAGDANVEIKKRPYLFRATGSTLKFKGFLAVYEETKPADKPDDDQTNVPDDLSEGELIDMLKLLPEQHFTQPPPRFSEATLVKALEENGVGRPSTYASTVSTIVFRGYVEKEDRRLHPTEIGKTVNDLLVEYFPEVLSVDFTAQMEDQLDAIAEGDKDWVPVVDAFYKPFHDKMVIADEKIPKVDLEAEKEYVGRQCPTCEEGELLYRQGRYGKFIGCERFPKCRHTEQVLVKTGVTCPVNEGELIEKRTRKGRIFYGCTKYPECQWTSWKKPVGVTDDKTQIVIEKKKEVLEETDCGLVPQEDAGAKPVAPASA